MLKGTYPNIRVSVWEKLVVQFHDSQPNKGVGPTMICKAHIWGCGTSIDLEIIICMIFHLRIANWFSCGCQRHTIQFSNNVMGA